MNSTTALLDQVTADLASAMSGDALAGLSDADAMSALCAAGATLRLIEGLIVETIASREPDFPDGFRCRSMNELLQRALLVDAPAAGRVVKTAAAVRREVNLVSGERMPARWPALHEAMLDGVVGITALLAATGALEQARDRISPEDRLRADAVLAEHARGRTHLIDEPDDGAPIDTAVTSGPPATPDHLKQVSAFLAMALDPDGAEPSDREAQARRFVTIGRLHEGGHRLSGSLTPEVAAQLQLIFDAYNNPKVGGAPAPGVTFSEDDETLPVDEFNIDPRNVIDSRTSAQKRHDALAASLGIAARHDEMPTLAGAAPTLVVHVDANELARAEHGVGWATLPDGTPIPARVAAHTGCTGVIQRVLFDQGRIVGITTTDRVFTVHQRRAIIARDRECLIPGCHVPASWCEIHHVAEHARGGPTHTDNGVPLCWWHHRSLDHSGWEIRMRDGLPQIRGPAWWDPDQHWHTPRLSARPEKSRRMPLRT